MTLGKGVDELQEKLQEQDMLLESYMVETLAGEALMEPIADSMWKFIEEPDGL